MESQFNIAAIAEVRKLTGDLRLWADRKERKHALACIDAIRAELDHIEGGINQCVEKDSVGDRYQTKRFALLSRRADKSSGTAWMGRSNYKTATEAREHLARVGQRYDNVGGITVDFGKADMLYDYKLVKMTCQCEVIHTERRLV